MYKRIYKKTPDKNGGPRYHYVPKSQHAFEHTMKKQDLPPTLEKTTFGAQNTAPTTPARLHRNP
jgi:hypothetical protein